MDSGGQTPEELETLLEDAFLLRDADAVARLFEDGSLLVTGEGSPLVRGREEILQVASLLCQNGRGYLADPRRVFQARDIALLIGEGVINVARRGQDGSWRFAISMLRAQHRVTPIEYGSLELDLGGNDD
jgi:hypothetical protein